MGGRPQKREKASGRKGWELGSTGNVKWIHVGIGVRCPRLRCPRFTLSSLGRWDVGTGTRWPRWDVGTLGRLDVWTFGRWDWVTFEAWDSLASFYVGTGTRWPRWYRFTLV